MGTCKILIADASPETLTDIESIIKIHLPEYELHLTSDGKSVCRMASLLDPDLIILDMLLPIIDGEGVIRILKRLKHTRHIPIVILSPPDLLAFAYQIGADDYLYKPFTEPELLFRIRFALRLSLNLKKTISQNEILLKQASEVNVKNEQLEAQRKDIIDDITYSRRIQNAIMPTRQTLSSLFPEHFLYYKPKRIVSGDFYWISNKDNKIIVAVADCTGHGISGAFLTIAGTAFLNEIIHYIQPDAGIILDQLRHRIMRLMQQKGLEGEARDGMDISLCIFDFDEMSLQYSGANNATYIVKKDGTLVICAPDHMPIGIHEHYNTSFKVINHNMEKGDMIYMFTDGYADQFGGEHDQKFRYRRLQQLCIENYNKPLCDQYEIFESTMDAWIGYRDQIDDMLVLGIRV